MMDVAAQLNIKAIEKLQLGSILSMVSQFAVSPIAKQSIISSQPNSDFNQVATLLSQTDEADKYITLYNINPDFSIDNVDEIVSKAKVKSVLSMSQLLTVMRLLKTSRLIDNALSTPVENLRILREMASNLYTNKLIEDEIDFAIISEDTMNDKASPKLYSLRQSIIKTNVEIKDKLNSYIRSGELSKYMQDSIVTVRGDRYVIPVKQEYKNFVNGLIHDQSSSGATVFIEPMAIVNLNNQLKELMLYESAEIERILREFTDKINLFAEKLTTNETIVSTLDCIFARAHFAHSRKCILPQINNNGYIKIVNGRHPLLDKNKVVPLSIELGKDFRIIVITGPNTGGKTVSLKTVGLFVLMVKCGLYVPASYCEISIFNNVWCDIGDEQSIEQSLSTFSSHITNISKIVDNVDSNSLVLLDELGAGTEPNEGAAIALAVTETLLNSQTKAILTTHYSQLKEYSLITDGIENACMEFSPITFEPTYKLVLGIPGSSNAIEIAKRLGLNDTVIANARSRMSQESITFENVLRQAEVLRQKNEFDSVEITQLHKKVKDEYLSVANKSKQLDEQREQLMKNSKSEARRIIMSAQEEADEIITQLNSLVEEAQLNESMLFKARQLKKELSDKKYNTQENEDYFIGTPIDINTLTKGDTVFVKDLNINATVVNIKKNKIDIKSGNISATVTADRLFVADTSAQQTKQQIVNHNIDTKLATRQAPTEINLLGLNVDEAISDVDAFIDNSVVCGLTTIRVVHGNGTGSLRAGLHEHFKRHPNIESFRLGKYGEGERGVTIITLK